MLIVTFSCEQCFCGWRSQSSMGCSMVDSSEVSLQSSGPSSTRQLSGAQILRGILSQKVTSRGSTSEAGATVVVLHSVSKKVSHTILGSAEPVPAKQHNNHQFIIDGSGSCTSSQDPPSPGETWGNTKFRSEKLFGRVLDVQKSPWKA